MEEYIKTLLEQVRCKKAHSMIEEEIRGHLEEQIVANKACGMEEEEAVREAVKDMGSPVEAGISLDRIHRPKIAWDMVLLIGMISLIGIVIHAMMGKDGVGSSSFAGYTILGFLLMLVIYRMDYTFMIRYAKGIAGIILGILLLITTEIFGCKVNGITNFCFGGFHFSIYAMMMLYIPVYGAILYQYYGSRVSGIVKALIWMILPVIFAFSLPNFSLAIILFFSMAVLLSLAVQKGWFQVSKKRFYIAFWGSFVAFSVFLAFAVSKLQWGAYQYQIERMKSFFITSDSVDTVAHYLRSCFAESQWIGNSGKDIMKIVPNVNSDYILTYLASGYGMLTALLLCGILVAVTMKMFHISLKQKNQLGMLMGCGCGMVFISNIIINIFENLGVLPSVQTFLPFFSAGGSCILVSYILIGMILSIYRYKNIYPARLKKIPGKITLSISVKVQDTI